MPETADVQSYTVQTEVFENLREQLFRTGGTERYDNVLTRAQQFLSKKLVSNDVSRMNEHELKDAILAFVTDYNVKCELTDSPSALTEYLYHDMAGYSFITRERLFDAGGFEELDINAWNDVDVIFSGTRKKTDYSFLSPKHALDIMRRIMQRTSQPFDEATPYVVTDMGSQIRIAAMRSPLIDEEKGVAASIRKVSGTVITRERLLSGMLDEKILDLLTLFVTNGVSVCFSGEVNSGKTTLSGFVLSQAAKTLRTYTIEEGSREWDFIQRDDNGNITNSVVHVKTRLSENPQQNFNQNKALQLALRFNPTVIGVGEMRSDEAYAAAEAATTGHTVVTTVHAESAAEAPGRLVGLCKKAYDFSDSTLLDLVTRAFPIQVSQSLFKDNKRRVTEIVEVLGAENGKVLYNTLVEFVVQDNIINEVTGEVDKVLGSFVWRGTISEKLRQKMLRKGATKSQLEPFSAKEGELA